ncbi:MAG: ABC transporter substrate-binding protein [Bacteroidetes bacterium HGW-Bacteroidetes-15]|nr:MAG: ABC transporter substrate-binding protein [Bacteroidetes bacterium HGW-Bacteroidetes-15]
MKIIGQFAFLLLLITSCLNGNRKDFENFSFRYNESKGITTLDPAFARSLPLIWPVHQLYNGLVQLNDSLNIKPSIAHSWEVSDNGLSYTFYLRNDVYFHDSPAFKNGKGRRVVADDFIFSFGRIINPDVASPGSWVFSILDINKPNTTYGCEAINDSTLVVNLKEPFPAFLGLLSMPYAYVVPHEALAYYGREFRSNPVGTGPFQFKYWREGEKLILRRNLEYFEFDENGNRLPYLESVSISFITDKQSEFLEFLLGNIDFISGVHAASKDELLTRSGSLNPRYSDRIKMITGPYLNTEYLGILVDTTLDIVRNSPLRFEEVRKAIGYGFDRAKLMTHLRSNMGYPAYNGFVPSGMPGFSEDVEGFSFNPELSRKLLAQAGFPEGRGLTPITLSTTDDYVDICEFIQHQLSEIGIPIEIEVFPGAAYRDMMANSKMAFFRGSWVADYADPENYLSLFHTQNFSPGGPNYTHFASREFDLLYQNSLWQPIDSIRYSIYQSMDSLVMSYTPVIPMYYDKVVRFVSNDVEGMKSNPMNLLNLKRIKKVKR